MSEFLSYNLITIGEYQLNVFHLFLVCLTLFTTLVFLWGLKFLIYKSKRLDTGRKYAIYQLLKYFVWVISIVLCLNEVGIKLTVLLAGSAALLVGVGLGLQNLFNDLVSGIIILIDGSIKVNDVIEVDGLVAKVQEIRLRTSSVITRDDKNIILPNSKLTSQQLINWTMGEDAARFSVFVGVAYGTDTRLVQTILSKVAKSHKEVLINPEPFVRFIDFADSALSFELLFWTNNVFRVENIKSELRFAIDDEFRKENITIPFPQRTVHLNK